MEINWFGLFANFGVNFLEFWICYFVVCALLGFKSIEAIKQLSFKIGGFALGYTLFLGVLSQLLTGIQYQAVYVLVMIILVYFLSKQLKIRVNRIDTILIYFLLYLIPHIIVIPSLLIFYSFGFSPVIVSISTFGATLMILFLLFSFIDLTLLYKLVTNTFIVRLIIFILFAIFVVSFAIFNFNTALMNEYIWLFIILIVIAINGLYYMFKFAHEYMNVMPNKYHDVRKILALLNSKMSDIDDLDAVKAAHQKAMELMNIEPVPTEEISIDIKNSFEALMFETIAFTQQENNSTTEIISDIEYDSPHPVVDDMTIAYLLGLLLENAIQTMTRKPIYIDVYSADCFVGIKVSNEAKHHEKVRLEAMLNQGSSTKAQIGRGFGLIKLKQAVKKYKGKISVLQTQRGKTNYLSVLVRF